MKKFLLIAIVLLFAFQGLSQDMLYRQLDNGMEIIVKENRSSNNVSLICFVKTGSIHEDQWLNAGISHFVEHLAIGSTTSKRSESEYVDWVERIGGQSNAYTTFNHTAYFLDVNMDFVEDAVQILSETMQFSIFTEEEVARERDVIIQEFVYRVSPPMATMRNRMMEVTYLQSHLKHEIIGDINIFRGLEREDLHEYYKERYAPNNMIFVVVGNIDLENTYELVKEAFKDFKPKSIRPSYTPTEIPRAGEYKFIEEFDINQARGFVNYIIPSAFFDDFPAIDLACQILFSKRSSPVQYRLVEELEIANWAYAYINTGYYSNDHSLHFIFEAKDPKYMDKILDTIDKTIKEIIEEGITERQIEEVINRMKAERILQVRTPMQEAMTIGNNMIRYGLPDVYDIHMKEYKKITTDDIVRVLERYFANTNRIVFYGVPTGSGELLEEEEEILISDINRIEKDNYITLHKQNTKAPLIHAYIHLPISSDYETVENVGTFQTMIDMMFWGGTEAFEPMEFVSWLEDQYITLSPNIAPHGLYIEVKSLKDDFPVLLSHINEIFNNPVFSERELGLHKQRLRARFSRESDNPDTHYDEFRNSVLYPGQKAGVSRQDELEIQLNLTREDLMQMHKDYFKADSIIAAFFGDLTLEEAEAYTKDIIGKVPSGEIIGEKTPLVVPKLNDTFINKTPFEQVSIVINYQGPTLHHEDYIPMNFIQLALGSGFGGRIYKATRRERDLVYAAYPRFAATDTYGFFRLVALTSLDNKDQLLEVLQEEIQKVKDGDITQEEIDAVVNFYELQVRSAFVDAYLVNTLSYYESIGLGYDYLRESIEKYRELTPERIQEVANKYFDESAIIISKPSEDVQRRF